jgi:preprotein translocase subunit SecG
MKRNLLFAIASSVGLVGLCLVQSGKSRADDRDGGKGRSVKTV